MRLISTGCGVQHTDVVHDPHGRHDPHHPLNTTISLASPVFGVWGANTGVGKTLISAGLASAFLQQQVLETGVMPPRLHARPHLLRLFIHIECT